MNNKGTDFPQFRMLSNGKVFYKIISETEFIEIQFLGEKKMEFRMVAEQYPEKLRIMDMLQCDSSYLVLPENLIHLFTEE
jgi:hypothetical protein